LTLGAGLRTHGPELAKPREWLSGPRYRGSNPCLPANSRQIFFESELPEALGGHLFNQFVETARGARCGISQEPAIASGMHDRQLEECLERVEIPVAMQKEWPSLMQNVAIRQSIVLRTVRLLLRNAR
jgi:hypothetical protein